MNLALEKDDELIILLGKMGAATLRIMESDTRERSAASGASASVDLILDPAPIGAKVGQSLARRIARNKELVVTFEGNVVAIDPNLLQTSLWFRNDSQLNAI